MSSRLLRNDNISASIPSYIREIQSLTQLDLSFNNIAGQIPDFPFNLSSLPFLFLGNNKLNGTLSATKSSRLLNVSYNNLTGRFPSWISELNLELNLVANNFTVGASNLRKVYVIDVIGAIPDELWSLTYLTNLNLGQNYLTGILSPSIGNLTRIQYLTIGIHASSGELPKELGMLTDLKVLGFGSNNFTSPL
ncbi:PROMASTIGOTE SURFACE ANTIGEN PROTEIN PSA [Salix koriyanagi]|uniref:PROMASTIGOTE SURFACE ANTIGEN PROTEIN PSA n=1 Tax=Salix koriyanagi TaxID=2511006 RepID=A0A9Q0UNB4_9ROSI|nr:PROMASTIGOTE SURFACE ANTIGEN PROTEIN PSA [Salix koriyanagi]